MGMRLLLRVHYVDEGPRYAEPVLLMHGEPSWSYLYRKMIPIITDAGYRAIAPDLVGFGRSDKPVEQADYTYQRHVNWMQAWLDQLDLQGITLVCQDWGGLIGLRLVPITPDDPASQANRLAWKVLSRFEKPLLTAFSDGDPITRGGESVFQKQVPGANGRPHTTIAGGGHFLQEDCGKEFADVVVNFIKGT